MNLNQDAAYLKVGDRVISEFDYDSRTVVRRLTRIEPDRGCGSGYRAWADAGEPCPHCKRCFADLVEGVDAAWFRLVEEVGRKRQERSEA